MASCNKDDVKKRTSADLLTIGGKPSTLTESLLLNKKTIPRPAQKLATFRLSESSVLSRVREFLPRLQQADEALRRRVEEHGADSVSIESAADADAPHIEMNLDLCELESDTDSGSSEDEGSDTEGATVGPVTGENIRLPGVKRRGLVTEVAAKDQVK